MGLGLAAVQLLLELHHSKKFNNFDSVMEIGSQEIHLKIKDLKELYISAGLEPSLLDCAEKKNNWPSQPRLSSKKIYLDLGFTNYKSADVNKELDSIFLDLNKELKDESLFNKFDLITDFGACEHVFNVAECYRTMHKMLKINGIMIIIQATRGGNGYFLFDRAFLEGIAASNEYKIIYSSYIVSTETKTSNFSDKQFHIPLSEDLVNKFYCENLGISMVFQKIKNDEFKFPYQSTLLSKIYNSFGYSRIYNRDDLSISYIPQFNIANISFKLLLKEIIKRIINRLKKLLN